MPLWPNLVAITGKLYYLQLKSRKIVGIQPVVDFMVSAEKILGYFLRLNRYGESREELLEYPADKSACLCYECAEAPYSLNLFCR